MNRLKAIGVGAHVWADWLAEGGVPVNRDIAIKRSRACIDGKDGNGCPFNQRGNWWDRLTGDAVQMIMDRRRLRFGKGLTIPNEEQLGHCSICHCPLDSKIWFQTDNIIESTSDEVFKELPSWCWIKKERFK